MKKVSTLFLLQNLDHATTEVIDYSYYDATSADSTLNTYTAKSPWGGNKKIEVSVSRDCVSFWLFGFTASAEIVEYDDSEQVIAREEVKLPWLSARKIFDKIDTLTITNTAGSIFQVDPKLV